MGFMGRLAGSKVWVSALALAVAFATAGAASPCSVPHALNPNHVLEGSDLQYKLSLYFLGNGPPPLEEVFFATQNLTRDTQEILMEECPGLLVSAFLVLAEARLPVYPVEAGGALAKADELASRLDPEAYEAAAQVWPIRHALASYHRHVATMTSATRTGAEQPVSVHLVVCHCRESLVWLSDGSLYVPQKRSTTVEVFIYEKCGKTEKIDPLLGLYSNVSVISVEDGAIRRDECSAYLRHLIDQYTNLADFTFFFQADAGDHMQWSYLALVMRAIERRALGTHFVHLNHPRLVASLSPCREKVFQQIFGRSPRSMLGSYCCAQFVVARERVLANPVERYEKMFQMLFEESPPECHDIPGHSTHCLMYEVYWHVLFGEPDDLPERALNTELPLFLRIRDLENECYLPPGSTYLQHALSEL